jgi:mannosyl-oligosaccharide alpha-1,2-mannosidase
MLRYRRYRVFVVFAVIALLAIYHFGSGNPRVDYLKQQLSFHGGKHEASASRDEVAQEIVKGAPPPPVKPKGKPDPIHDAPAAAADTKVSPPPVKEAEKPKQHAPPGAKGKDEPKHKGKGPVKAPVAEDAEVKETKGKDPVRKPGTKAPLEDEDASGQTPKTTKEDEDRIRVMPNPIPANAFEKVHPWEHGEGRWENDQLPLDAAPVFWQKPPEHFPISDSSIIPLPTGKPKQLPKIQAEFAKETAEQKEDRLAKKEIIKEAFMHAWTGYKVNAWGHDEVKPISGGFANPFNGWGATLVDSLDIIWMMGLEKDFEDAVEQVSKINFKTSRRNDIPLFETTIRYLGGLLGAYDVSGGKYRVLLDKAAELAEILIGAFDTPNRMPDTFYQWKPDFASQPHRSGSRVVLAELGSLALEFTRLAQLTKEPRYYDAIARITDALEEWQGKTRLPGMWPSHLDASGCEKIYSAGPSSQEILTQGTVQVLDPQGRPLVTSGSTGPVGTTSKDFAPAAAVDKDGGLTGKDAVTSNRDEDELHGVEVKGPLKPGKSGKGGDAASESGLDDSDIKKGRIPGWDEVHSKDGTSKPKKQTAGKSDAAPKDDSSTPKLPPPKKQGADNEFVPLDLPDPVVFNVKGGKKEKRQLHDLDAKVAAEKGPTSEGLSSYSDSSSIPSQLTGHKHDEDLTLPFSPTVPDYSKQECIPQGLTSQSKWGTDDFTLGSLADSTYEYLPKMHLLLNGVTSQYRSMYEKAADAAKEHLLFRQMIPDEKREILVSGSYSVTTAFAADGETPQVTGRLRAGGSHLTCFVGGMFALGSKLFDRKDDLEIAKKLTDGCVYAYSMTASGIMPETFNAVACDDRKSCPWNETKWYEALDPDLGEWRMKSYQASVELYETALKMREKGDLYLKKQSQTQHKTVAETLKEIEDEDIHNGEDEMASVRQAQRKTVVVGAEDDDDEEKAEKNIASKKSGSGSDLMKRQLHGLSAAEQEQDSVKQAQKYTVNVGSDSDEVIAAKLAKDASLTSSSDVEYDRHGSEQAAKEAEIVKGTYDQPESAWLEPGGTGTATYELPPLYSPIKPPSHEEFVRKMIEEDRLPEGVQSMGDRRYILRYVLLSF